MTQPKQENTGCKISRRSFLGTAGAAAAVSAIPLSQLQAQVEQMKAEGWEANPIACTVCGGYCGLLAMKKKGEPISPATVRIMPNPSHPQRGYCGRGAQAFFVWNHPMRLRKPMKRVGAKGEGKFEEISWDQALNEIAARVKEIVEKDGEHAITMTSHNFSGYQKWFAAALGTPNVISHSSSCNSSSIMGRRMVFGKGMDGAGKIEPDYENASMLLCIGRSLNCAIGVHTVVARAREQGLKVVFIDPRMPQGALTGSQWVPIRPGTDAALLLGMINVAVTEGLHDADWLMRHTNAAYLVDARTHAPVTQAMMKSDGSDKLFAAVTTDGRIVYRGVEIKDGKPVGFVGEGDDLDLNFAANVKLADGTDLAVVTAYGALVATASKYTPKEVNRITGIRADEFLTLTREFFKKKGVIDDGWYASRNGNDSTAFALMCVVNLFVGHMDKVGGMIVTQGGGFKGPSASTKGTKGKGPKGQSWEIADGKRLDTVYYPEGSGTYSAVYEAIHTGKPYPVRGLFITGSTMFHREANTERMAKAMKALDLLVVQDIFPHEIADYADYVLPTTYFMETRDIVGVKWARDGYVQMNDAHIDPPEGCEARDEIWQFCEILRRAYPERAAERLGYDRELKTRAEYLQWYGAMVDSAWKKFVAQKNEAKPGEGDRIANDIAKNGWALASKKKYGVYPYAKPVNTPTGKPEIVSFYVATKYLGKGLDPVHDWALPPAYTQPKADNEFYLVSGKDASGSSGVTLFTKASQYIGDRTAWGNPRDAQRLGVKTGDQIEMTGIDTGVKGTVEVTVTNRVMPGSIFCHSFQGDVQTKQPVPANYEWIREGLNTNRLCTAYNEKLVGSSVNNCTVRVKRL